MRVNDLSVSGLRLLGAIESGDLELEVRSGGMPEWSVLLGDNGSGKSSILQSIALAALGPRAAQDVVDNAGIMVDRRLGPAGRMRIAAEFEIGGERISSVMEARRDSRFFTGYSWRGSLDAEPEPAERGDILSELWGELRNEFPTLIVGLGVLRRLPNPNELPPKGRSSRLVGSLFGRPSWSTNIIDLIAAEAEDIDVPGDRHATHLLSEYLERQAIDAVGALGRISHLERRGAGGTKNATTMVEGDRFHFRYGDGEDIVAIPASSLSHGYQAIISIVVDILGNAFLEYGRTVPPAEVEGVALIDEVDLHLHPAWQMEVIRHLRELFPRMQFLVTTHSPMTILSLRTLDELFILRRSAAGDCFPTRFDSPDPQMSSAEILNRYFDIDRAIDVINDLEVTYLFLRDLPNLTDEQRGELDRARSGLVEHGVDPDAHASD